MSDILDRLRGNGEPFSFSEVVAEIERLRAGYEELALWCANNTMATGYGSLDPVGPYAGYYASPMSDDRFKHAGHGYAVRIREVARGVK